MCGIAGIISKDPGKITMSRLKDMTGKIAHRGPDGDGHWISQDGRVGLGHRRLSIIDLSQGGHQPMCYANDRYTITFNGEIYNYLELKETLLSKGYVFRSASDTEVLMAMYDMEGENCLKYLDGMFAFVIYDDREKSIFCARDRFGEKPLFYSYIPGETFIFGSEMKAIWAAGVEKRVNPGMLYNYLAYNHLENENDRSETFYQQVFRLENAHFLKFDIDNISIVKKKYWDIDYENIDYGITDEKAAARFRELFSNSVQRRLRSDVPVGSSLSGGLDSSLVVCAIDKLNVDKAIKQKTFSARFPGFKKDEGHYMQMVIDKVGAEAFFTFPDENNLLDKINEVYYHQEEPFGSASICVQYEVMRLAKMNNVIVLLDGQGADEVLAGYHLYYIAYFNELQQRDKSLYNKAVADYRLLHADNQINSTVLGSTSKMKQWVRKTAPSLVTPLIRMKNNFREKTAPVFNREFYHQYSAPPLTFHNSFQGSLNKALYYSAYMKGLSELLRYADRNSMAHSREVRLPFLSHDLVEFLFTLPASFKIRNGWTKYIMREAFNDILPEAITWRKDKIGYEPPQKSWMDVSDVKGAIQASKEKLVGEGVLNKKILDKAPTGAESNSRGDNSWQYWMAGKLFEV